MNYKYKNYFYFLTNHCLTRYMCCKWVYISFFTRYLHPSLHLIFFSFIFYKILIAVCDASFQQQLIRKQKYRCCKFLKVFIPLCISFSFLFFLLHFDCSLCVCKKKYCIITCHTLFFPFCWGCRGC